MVEEESRKDGPYEIVYRQNDGKPRALFEHHRSGVGHSREERRQSIGNPSCIDRLMLNSTNASIAAVPRREQHILETGEQRRASTPSYVNLVGLTFRAFVVI